MKAIDVLASSEHFYSAVLAVCLLACTFCGIEGGLQVHLSHDHPAFECVTLALSEGAKSPVPPCTSPDVVGEPWRLRLVGLDLAGFLTFGTLWTKLRAERKRKSALSRTSRTSLFDV